MLAALAEDARSASELAAELGLQSKTGSLKRTLVELVDHGFVEYVLPDKPTSRVQRYRLTANGRRFLKTNNGTRR